MAFPSSRRQQSSTSLSQLESLELGMPRTECRIFCTPFLFLEPSSRCENVQGSRGGGALFGSKRMLRNLAWQAAPQQSRFPTSSATAVAYNRVPSHGRREQAVSCCESMAKTLTFRTVYMSLGKINNTDCDLGQNNTIAHPPIKEEEPHLL